MYIISVKYMHIAVQQISRTTSSANLKLYTQETSPHSSSPPLTTTILLSVFLSL